MFEMVPAPWMVLPLVKLTLGVLPVIRFVAAFDMVTLPAPLKVTLGPEIFNVDPVSVMVPELVSVPDEVRFSVELVPTATDPMGQCAQVGEIAIVVKESHDELRAGVVCELSRDCQGTADVVVAAGSCSIVRSW